MLNVTVYISHLLGNDDFGNFIFNTRRRIIIDDHETYKVQCCNGNSLICLIHGKTIYDQSANAIHAILTSNYRATEIKNFVKIMDGKVTDIMTREQRKINSSATTTTTPEVNPTYFIHFGAIYPDGLDHGFVYGAEMEEACRQLNINNVYALSSQRRAIPSPLIGPDDDGYETLIAPLESTVSTEMNLLSSLVIFCEGYLYNRLDSVKDMTVGRETKKLLSDLGKLKKPKVSKKPANRYDINTAFDNTLQECVKKEYKALTKNDLNEQSPLLKLCKMINVKRLTVTEDLTKTIIGAYEELAQILKTPPRQAGTDSRA